MNYTSLIALAIGAAIGGSAAWKWQAANINEIKLEQANERISRDRANRAQADQRIAANASAQAKAANSIILSTTDRAAIDRIALGLRDTTAAVVRACADSPATCPRKAAALGVVFDRCAATAVGMGSDAQGWVIEAVKQNDAAKQ